MKNFIDRCIHYTLMGVGFILTPVISGFHSLLIIMFSELTYEQRLAVKGAIESMDLISYDPEYKRNKLICSSNGNYLITRRLLWLNYYELKTKHRRYSFYDKPLSRLVKLKKESLS